MREDGGGDGFIREFAAGPVKAEEGVAGLGTGVIDQNGILAFIERDRFGRLMTPVVAA